MRLLIAFLMTSLVFICAAGYVFVLEFTYRTFGMRGSITLVIVIVFALLMYVFYRSEQPARK